MNTEFEEQLAEAMAECSDDPYSFVMLAFPWGTGALEGKRPEEWQVQLLKDIRDKLLTVQEALKFALASGHGIGKSALVAWLVLWALCTFPETRGIVTANTEKQLLTKTWPEVRKWFNLCICKHWFEMTATSIFSADERYKQSWRIDMIPWSKSNPDAFAGLHNQGKRLIVIFDEASQIWDKIWEVTEGAMTDLGTQILWLAFGNPTQNTGCFYDCFHKNRDYWDTRQIDSRTVSFTNKAQIAKWVAQYGEDSDFIKVRVRGVFPSQASNQLIPLNVVLEAQQRQVYEDKSAPLLMMIDVARYGDDESVIRFRQGRDARSFPIKRYQKMDNHTLAREVAKMIDYYKPDGVFIDGGGVGGGVVDNLRAWKYQVIEVNFGETKKSLDQPDRYVNKRAEMYDALLDWLVNGGAIDDDAGLKEDLTAIQYFFNGQKMQLMSKEDMKATGLPSPDDSDCLAMSFYCPVRKRASHVGGSSGFKRKTYDWSI